ncbi:cell envelope biogenesis protein OmpA [Tamlana sp. 2_MG-2023]|uniref:cell envelope biogenesis protein OmpA n=1 Tax=unclassified Tamlana TaxID=2614803 RepID=UPI0026E18C00|nr:MULTISPECIES: cell envelope biogenesis protein OmpA [unclassified Tamlana]MDO6761776.1 cell envelope biogenesis protein OmpA [Tamlana sp. 2_MG-2023]MDO6792537.1 cell envelope biogenesis protein OmpA [Tamlana sp. 1_MG-2023]
MIAYFKKIKSTWIVAILFFWFGFSQAQDDSSTFKVQFATGINTPMASGFVSGFDAKPINFPTINLGVQYLFSNNFGAKLDLGYNRFSNKKNTTEFKTNYTRINLQGVYDASRIIRFSPRMATFLHAGPGFTMITPLADYGENKTNFMNAMVGAEFHYGINDVLSIYLDGSYIFGFGKAFDPPSDGFGAFNGDILTVTIGASISLSGCYYCND